MTDKNKDAQLKDAEAKTVSGGQWSDQWRPNQANAGDGTSVTPPSPTKDTVQLWETIGAPGVDEIPRG